MVLVAARMSPYQPHQIVGQFRKSRLHVGENFRASNIHLPEAKTEVKSCNNPL